MPNPGQRRNISSFIGKMPRLELPDGKLDNLIAIIRKSKNEWPNRQFVTVSRTELKNICNRYRVLRFILYQDKCAATATFNSS